MKTIVILDKQDNFTEIIKNIKKIKNSKNFSVDHKTHEILLKNGIKHVLADTIIDTETRLKIHQQSFSYLKWFNHIHNNEFEFCGRNMLEIIDDNEFQILLSQKISKIFCIKNILDTENPEKIVTTYENHKIIKNLGYNHEIEFISEIKNKERLFFDTIEINFNSKILPDRISLSRNRYLQIKNLLENIISKIYDLEYKNNKQNNLLFVEFNPESYDKLLNEIKNFKMQPVLINFRRSSVWSKKSINILRNSNAKIVTYNHFLDRHDKKKILKNGELFRKKILELFENDSIFRKIFSIDGIEFWNMIKAQVLDMYLSRIEERLSYIVVAEKLFKMQKFQAILSLNLSGETEKIFSDKNNAPSVLLQHAFGNYSRDIKSLEMTDDLNLIKDKIAVWGNVMKDYLIKNYHILEKDIIVSGSPRHDSFFGNSVKNQKDKCVLLTPRPIIHDIDGENSIKYEQYKITIEKVLDAVKKNNLELIVKLHPQKNEHNEQIIKIINSIDSEIRIFQTGSISNLLERCNLMINLSPDNYDASTTILEAMIMKKPIIDVSLVKERYDFEFLKDEAIYALDSSSDIENAILELQTNSSKRDELIKRSQIHLEKYLANHGNASKKLAQKLSGIN